MEQVYQHFRKEEQPFIDMVESWVIRVQEQYSPYLSDFLDPRQQYIVEMLVGKKGEVQVDFFGGYEAAERKRAFLYPEYFQPKQEDYEIKLYEIQYPTKFAELSHGKILGTLIGSGMKREMFGDIMTNGEQWQFFVAHHVHNYIESQLTKIGKVTVRLEEKSYTDLIMPTDDWTIESGTVSSLRADTVISSVYNISRQRAKELITSGKVKLNWAPFERADFELGLLDILSIRGYGRIQLRAIEGKSKKDKWRIEFGVLRK
ncbi:RNA-binding protein [Jeotgalibaca caeni]|uniref:YlmH family RNA-binding protein n=1 Tax=Jeotgalibaca caeni TaxID=3028623 RepID=UPI00237D410D|nr:RNA-binding protein [Jeotgalibaca caeni]MDE1547927.1 RNA-binding protein [Jeotgalibaca caeni]